MLTVEKIEKKKTHGDDEAWNDDEVKIRFMLHYDNITNNINKLRFLPIPMIIVQNNYIYVY